MSSVAPSYKKPTPRSPLGYNNDPADNIQKSFLLNLGKSTTNFDKLKLCNLIENYELKEFLTEVKRSSELNNLNIKELFSTIGFKDPDKIQSFLTGLFSSEQNTVSLAFQSLFSVTQEPADDKLIVWFLHELCSDFNGFYFPLSNEQPSPSENSEYFNKSSPPPGHDTKEGCLEGMKKNPKNNYYFLRYNAFLVEEFSHKLYSFTPQNASTPSKEVAKITSNYSLHEQINQTERYLKELEHIENGVLTLDKDKLFALSAKGAGLNLLYNFFTNQGPTIDNGIGPVIEQSLGHTAQQCITNYGEAPILLGLAGFLFSYWRNQARTPKEHIQAEKNFHACLLGKLMAMYASDPKNPPLTDTLLERVKKYSPRFPVDKIKKLEQQTSLSSKNVSSAEKGSSSKDASSIEEINLIKNTTFECDEVAQLKLSIREVKTQNYSQQSIENLAKEINQIELQVVKSQIIKIKLRLQEDLQKNHTTERMSHLRCLDQVLEKYFFDKLIALYSQRTEENASELKKKLEGLISETVNLYSNYPIFAKKIQGSLKDCILSIEKRLEHFMHGTVFKTSKKTMFKYDKSRGSLFGQLLQLYNRAKDKVGKEQLKKLINNRLAVLPPTSSNSLAQTLYNENKNILMGTDWKDRRIACQTVERMLTRILNSDLSSAEKRLFLKCMQENFKEEGLTGATIGVEERRKIAGIEKTAILGYQAFNTGRMTSIAGGGNSAQIGESGIGWLLAVLISPVLQLISTTNTTTKKSLLAMFEGAILYVENTKERAPLEVPSSEVKKEEDFDKTIASIHKILSKKENKTFIPETSQGEILNTLKNLKHQHLSLILEHKHGRKTCLLLELMDKMQGENFNEFLKLYFTKKDLDHYLHFGGQADLNSCEGNDVEKFTRFLSQEINRAKYSKKDAAFVVVKGIAYLSHLHEEISALPEESEEEKNAKSKQQRIFERCRQRFEEIITNAYENENSQFRILTRMRNKSSIFFRQAFPRMLGGAIYGAGGSTITKILQGAILVGTGIAIAMSGVGLILGIAIPVILGAIRLILVAIADRPNAIHSKNTNTYSHLTRQQNKLPRFDVKKDPLDPEASSSSNKLSSYGNTKQKSDAINKNLMEKLSNPSQGNYENFSQELEKQLEALLVSTDLDKKRIGKINEFIDEMNAGDLLSDEQIKEIFNKIKIQAGLDNSQNDFIIDKSHRLELFMRLIYIVNGSKAAPINKVKLLMLAYTEIDDKNSSLGHLKNENSYVRKKNWFALHAVAGVFAAAGILASVLLFPALLPVGVAFAVFLHASTTPTAPLAAGLLTSFVATVSDYITGKLTNTNRYDSSYGNTESSKQAKLLIKNTLTSLLISSQDILQEEHKELKKQVEEKLNENNSRRSRIGDSAHLKIYRKKFPKSSVPLTVQQPSPEAAPRLVQGDGSNLESEISHSKYQPLMAGAGI